MSTKALCSKLEAAPNHICFKNYEEQKVYKKLIKITNKDAKDLYVAVNFDNTEELKVSTVDTSSKSILETEDDLFIKLEFSPSISFKNASFDRRYEICINVINSNTKLLIPILILSTCPIINFPREIQLPDVAINMPSYSNIVVLNYSNVPYKFSIETRNEVKIIPACKAIAVKPGDGSIFLIEFIPNTLADFREKLNICFENGTRMTILLKCKILPVNICLDREIVEFPPTHIGMRSTRSIQIVNKSETATFFEWIAIGTHVADENNEAHPWMNFFEINPMNGESLPQTITKVDLIFKPEDINNDDDDFEILKEISITLGLKLSICQNYQPSIISKGSVLGPCFQIDHKIININEVYIGETRDVEIYIKNTGVISGKFSFHTIQSTNDGIIDISIKSGVVHIGESKKVKIKFLARKIGKFIDQAIFKVKNGEHIKFAIQGLIMPLNITTIPCSLEFSASSICIPQMRLVTLKNELPFDVDITLEIENNGTDDPLEFIEFYRCCNNSISKSPSFESMDSCSNIISAESSSSFLTRTSIKNFMERNGKIEKLRDELTIGSEIVEIFNKVDDYLECKEIINDITSMLIDDKLFNEIEKKQIVEFVVEILIESMMDTESQKFNEKIWLIPENPRQFERNKKIIKLDSGKSDEVKIFSTTNFIGKFTRNLIVCVSMRNLKHKRWSVDASITKVPIVIDCQIADIVIHNQSNEIRGYVASKILLNIRMENVSSVDGFYSFQNLSDSEMEVKFKEQKFHIPAKSNKTVNLMIVPLVSGEIKKFLNLTALGSNKKYPILIECDSLPPNITVEPRKILLNDLEVLKKDDTRIFIENHGTTKARFFAKLEHENECLNINPRGGILSSRQCIMVMIEKLFLDPGDYSDVLVVEVINGKAIKIPIKCTVKKLPIIIEPSFSNIIDFGTLFITKNSLSQDYNFTNGGKKSYMIFIILNNKKNRKEIPFKIDPNRFELSPNCSQVVKFSLNAENAISCENEFTIEGCSIQSPVRELIWESKVKTNVITPWLNLSSRNIIFNCYYGQDDDLMETLDVTNNSLLAISCILKVEGDFFITNQDKSILEKNAILEIESKQNCKVFIAFDGNLMKEFNKTESIQGILKVCALGKLYATLKLTANLIFPEIELSTNSIDMVANIEPCSSCFMLTNPSDELSASFELEFKDERTVITQIDEKYIEDSFTDDNKSGTYFFTTDDEISSPPDDTSSRDYQTNDSSNSSNVTNDNEEVNKDVEIPKTVDVFNECKFCDGKTIEWGEVAKCIDLLTTGISKHECFKKSEYLHPTSKVERHLTLNQIKGTLKPKENLVILVQFLGSRKAFHLSSILNCKVLGGCCHDIEIKITNCSPTILITKTHFDIRNSWQNISINNLLIRNINPIRNDIRIITSNDGNKIIKGFVKLNMKSHSNFVLDHQMNVVRDVRFSIFTGCMPIFKGCFHIQVSSKPPIPITFYSKNYMPMVTLLDIDRPSLFDMHKTFEWECLREMFKNIEDIKVEEEVIDSENVLEMKLKFQQQQEELMRKTPKKSLKKGKASTVMAEKIDNLSTGDNSGTVPNAFELLFNNNGSAIWREKPLRMFSGKMLQIVDDDLEKFDFVTLDYPNEYPHAHEIISFIAQYGFSKSLEADEIFTAYRQIYDQHVIEKFEHSKKCRGHGICREGFCDKTIVVPLPLVLPEYSINWGDLKIDETYEKVVRIYLHDDFASIAIRSEAIIDNFSVEFSEKCCKFFKIINYENEKVETKYMNRLERAMMQNEQTNSVRRCHSFDFIEGKVHARIISKSKRDLDYISQIYNEKMSTKVKLGDRNPFTMTELFQVEELTGDQIIEFKIIFSLKFNSYEDGMLFDEILYLDIHLGPQIPLHITANIVDLDAATNLQINNT